MIGTGSNYGMELLGKAVGEYNLGNRLRAKELFREVLRVESHNETALLWLAYLADDPYQAVDLLQTLLRLNPRHEMALSYLEMARRRCDELDNLVTASTTYSTWSRIRGSGQTHDTTKRAIPFLGEYLLKEGLITQQQLDMALRRHKELAQRGSPKQVGQVMVELGYLTQAQLEKWLQMQSGEYSYQFRD
jgi:tetratricopeptide (TPR) repeat protein